MANLYEIFREVTPSRRISAAQSRNFLQLIIGRTEQAFAAAGLAAGAWRTYDTNHLPQGMQPSEQQRLLYAQWAATLADQLLASPPRNNRDMLLYLLGACGEIAGGRDLGTALLKTAAREGGRNTPRRPPPYAAPLLTIAKEHAAALAAAGGLTLTALTEALMRDPRVAELGMPCRRTRVKAASDGPSPSTLRRWARRALHERSKEQSGS